MVGLSEVMGSWGMKAISLPRTFCIPLRRASPGPFRSVDRPTDQVTVVLQQPHDRKPMVVLPQPDSPTRPTHSPSLISKVTSSTATTLAVRIRNSVRKITHGKDHTHIQPPYNQRLNPLWSSPTRATPRNDDASAWARSEPVNGGARASRIPCSWTNREGRLLVELSHQRVATHFGDDRGGADGGATLVPLHDRHDWKLGPHHAGGTSPRAIVGDVRKVFDGTVDQRALGASVNCAVTPDRSRRRARCAAPIR